MATTKVDRGGPDPIDVTVGLKIRDARKARKLSQEQLGTALGMSFQQIQKYERGANRVSASVLVRLADYLGVAPGSLLPATTAIPANATLEALDVLANTRGAAELVFAYAQMPPRLRSELLRFARIVALDAEPESAAA
ncbi:MAG: helix-turn-helix transcriptional regulator [Caulobacteraceae bacterium]